MRSTKKAGPGYSGFHLSSKTNISKFQFDPDFSGRIATLWRYHFKIPIIIIIIIINIIIIITSLRYTGLNTERFREFTVDAYLLIPSAEVTFEPFEGVAVQTINLKFLQQQLMVFRSYERNFCNCVWKIAVITARIIAHLISHPQFNI